MEPFDGETALGSGFGSCGVVLAARSTAGCDRFPHGYLSEIPFLLLVGISPSGAGSGRPGTGSKAFKCLMSLSPQHPR